MTERLAAPRFTVESVAPLVAPHATTVESVVTRHPAFPFPVTLAFPFPVTSAFPFPVTPTVPFPRHPRSLFSGGCGRDGEVSYA